MRGIKLTPTTRALANATSKNDDRPILSGVKITKREAVAANGFIVIIKAMPAPGMNLEQIGDDGINEVIVPSDALKACDGKTVILETIEAMREPKGGLLPEDPGTKIVVRLSCPEPDFSIEADSLEGQYPDHTKLFSKSPLMGQVALDTALLKKLLKSLPDTQIRFRIGEPGNAVEFQCTDPDGDIPIKGLIMPMTCDWQQVKWLTKP